MTPEQQLVQQIIQVINSNQLEGNVLLTDYSEQFAEMCRLANERLIRCNDYLDKGMRSEAIYEAHTQPDLLQLAELLSSDELKRWRNVCVDLELTPFQPLNEQIIARLKKEESQEDNLSPLLKEYRRYVYQSDHENCIRVLREIREKDPTNPAWKTNLEPLETATLDAWVQQAESALAAMDLQRLKVIFNELNHPFRVVPPPEDLMKRLRVALMSERSGDLKEDGEKLLGKLRKAMSAKDSDEIEAQIKKCEDLATDEAFLNKPSNWEATLKEAKELLETLARRRAKQADFNKALSGLRDTLEGGRASEMELRHEWERVQAWEMPIPDLLRKQVEETLDAKREARMRRTKLIAYATMAGIVCIVALVLFMVWGQNRRHRRNTQLEEMQALYEGSKIDELEKYMEQVKENDSSFFKSPEVSSLYGKLQQNKEKYNQMAATFKNRRDDLETIRKGGYHAENEQIERLLKEGQENATSSGDSDWLRSWRNGWEAWAQRQASAADGQLERAVQQIDTALLSMKEIALDEEREKLASLKDAWEKAQPYEIRASEDVRKQFVAVKEKLDARILDFNKRDGDAKAAATAKEAADKAMTDKLAALRRDIPRALPDFTRYEQLLKEFVAIGEGQPEFSDYQIILKQFGIYPKASLLSKFNLPSLVPGSDGEKRLQALLQGDAVSDGSVWKTDLERANELINATKSLRRKLMGLLSGNQDELQIYIMKFRRKGENRWQTLYSPEPIMSKTTDGVTQYWGTIYWSENGNELPHLVHTGKVFPDKLTTTDYEFEKRAREEDNLAPHTRFLRKLIAEANEASDLDVHLLKGLMELRGSLEIDMVPSAWLAKRLVYFLNENCQEELPESAKWVDVVKAVNTDVPWMNRDHPATKEAARQIAEMWVNLPDFTPFIKRLEANRAMLCLALSAGVQCVGSLQRDAHGALQMISSGKTGGELWILRASASQTVPFFLVLSDDGKTLNPDVMRQDCFAGQPVFSPMRGHEAKEVLLRQNLPDKIKETMEWPHSWPDNVE
ncbi:MAG: hypothetical protein IKZ46_14070 [Victivallales bacterium]|nr:hypothetical protein [Victivallales bacterium]